MEGGPFKGRAAMSPLSSMREAIGQRPACFSEAGPRSGDLLAANERLRWRQQIVASDTSGLIWRRIKGYRCLVRTFSEAGAPFWP